MLQVDEQVLHVRLSTVRRLFHVQAQEVVRQLQVLVDELGVEALVVEDPIDGAQVVNGLVEQKVKGQAQRGVEQLARRDGAGQDSVRNDVGVQRCVGGVLYVQAPAQLLVGLQVGKALELEQEHVLVGDDLEQGQGRRRHACRALGALGHRLLLDLIHLLLFHNEDAPALSACKGSSFLTGRTWLD